MSKGERYGEGMTQMRRARRARSVFPQGVHGVAERLHVGRERAREVALREERTRRRGRQVVVVVIEVRQHGEVPKWWQRRHAERGVVVLRERFRWRRRGAR
jgi:hypothetical protein